ncbi:MAG: type VI secretion system tip protein VgrG [Phaeodactylibacter sp.]|nr:type VI secretion system tip protein VgrG [Phaeodactylibacter sp.]MCB9301674.1 type VI secretion system tip protein VgrG [Lewinellaceae bacterium]
MSNGRVLPIQSTTGATSFDILVDGNALPQTYQLLSIVTHKEVNRVPMAFLVLRDGDAASEDFAVSNEDKLIPGKTIEIKMGYDSTNTTVFKGIIIKHGIKVREGGSVLEISCKDESVKMTIGRKNKYFTEAKDSDAIEEILGGYGGLSKSVEATGPTHQELVQYYTTDWDFMLSRAEANGKLVLVDDGKVTVKAPDFGGVEQLTLIYGSTLFEFEAEMDARSQYQGVTSSSWDYAGQQMVQADGRPPGANPQGNIRESSLAGVAGPSSLELRHSGHVVDQELQAWADATLLKSHLAKIIGRAMIQGFPDIKPGNMVKFEGVGERFNGKAFLTAVRHEMNAGAWYTHLQFGRPVQWFYEEHELAEKPAAGLLPGVNGLQIGLVKGLEGDPDGDDRIKVQLPVVDAQAEGIWARLASLDAGQNRGFVFRPEIGDEVIVGFLNDDPRDPVVLGMLHSSAKPAPIPAKDDNHEKGLVTRSEMKLHFDDDKKIITVETPGGNKAILDDDAGSITLQDQNGNKIVMDSNGIALESAKDITLKATGNVKVEGVNLEQKAQAQFKAEGSAGLELKSSAIAKLQGSLVQIN